MTNVPIQSLIDHIKTAVDVDPWAKEMAEELLKEQEAVKPKLSMSGLWYECPVCNRHLTKDMDNYCARCGRSVKWGE